MQTIASSTVVPTPEPAGVVVSSAIEAGAIAFNHSEGIVVHTAITAGGRYLNHSEAIVQPAGIAVTTPIHAGGLSSSPGF